MSSNRFHGRHESDGKLCNWPGCKEAGEFRAPGARSSGFDGPGDYRWFCLEHVREFNSGYDFFTGMSAEEIFNAQSPLAGWDTHSRAFRGDAGVDGVPRWADFADPLEAISARAKARAQQMRDGMNGAARDRATAGRFSSEERRALSILGLDGDADRRALRGRYTQLVRKFHPDHNGGDRSLEARLQQVVDAYQVLRKASAFA